MSLNREAAMNAELRSSARRTGRAGASREPCLTERTQQCQGGLGAWKHDPHDQKENRPSYERPLPGRATSWRVRVAPLGRGVTVPSLSETICEL